MINKMNTIIIILNIISVYVIGHWVLRSWASAMGSTTGRPTPEYIDKLVVIGIISLVVSIIISHMYNNKTAIVLACIPIAWYIVCTLILVPIFYKNNYKDTGSIVSTNTKFSHVTREYICRLPSENAQDPMDWKPNKIEEFYTIHAKHNILVRVSLFSDKEPNIQAIGKISGTQFESHIPLDLLAKESDINAKNCFDAEGKTIYDNYTIVDMSVGNNKAWNDPSGWIFQGTEATNAVGDYQ